jgi:hypothetical protein
MTDSIVSKYTSLIPSQNIDEPLLCCVVLYEEARILGWFHDFWSQVKQTRFIFHATISDGNLNFHVICMPPY